MSQTKEKGLEASLICRKPLLAQLVKKDLKGPSNGPKEAV